jgi:hypothetical protein
MSRFFDSSLNIYTVVLVDEFCKFSWNQSKLFSPFVWEGNRTAFTEYFATILRAQHVTSPAFTIIASLFSSSIKIINTIFKKREKGCGAFNERVFSGIKRYEPYFGGVNHRSNPNSVFACNRLQCFYH